MERKKDEQCSFWLPECFDPVQDCAIVYRKLPHWCQAGVISFITWRTWDSMPVAVVRLWQAERDAWLRKNGVEPSRPGWELLLQDWPAQQQQDFRRYVSDRWLGHLDDLHGECVLRRPECARVVAESLRYFDGTPHAPREDGVGGQLHAERDEYRQARAEREGDAGRYFLSDYVVMPNHVHVLVAFPAEEAMLNQCESWKHYTAQRINKILRRRGRFWQQDAFDHLVRSPEEFERLRQYIADNPVASRLQPGEYLHYRKD